MGRLRRLVRVVVVGRRDGIRARIRRTLGLWTHLDEPPTASASPAPQRRETPPETASEAVEVAPAEEAIPEGWERVIGVDELSPGEVIEVVAGDRAFALANVDGEVYGLDNVCPHAGGPLGDGDLDGCTLTCPWHGWSFDVRDGSCSVSDQVHVETIRVRVFGDAVYVSP